MQHGHHCWERRHGRLPGKHAGIREERAEQTCLQARLTEGEEGKACSSPYCTCPALTIGLHCHSYQRLGCTHCGENSDSSTLVCFLSSLLLPYRACDLIKMLLDPSSPFMHSLKFQEQTCNLTSPNPLVHAWSSRDITWLSLTPQTLHVENSLFPHYFCSSSVFSNLYTQEVTQLKILQKKASLNLQTIQALHVLNTLWSYFFSLHKMYVLLSSPNGSCFFSK